MTEENQTRIKVRDSYLIPAAIVIAGSLVAGAVFLTSDQANTTGTATDTEPKPAQEIQLMRQMLRGL